MRRNNDGAVMLRVVTAVAALALTLLLVWVKSLRIEFVGFIAILCAAGIYEYHAMARLKGHRPAAASIGIGFFVILSAIFWNPIEIRFLPELILCSAFIMCVFLHLFNDNHCLSSAATSIFGVIYVAWLPVHIVWLHGIPRIGPGLFMILLVVLTLSDSGAYFVGKSLGKHKLAPKVSPNKTWEGAVGGVVFAVIGMLILAKLQIRFDCSAFPNWSLMFYALIAVVLSVVGQVGDLFESLLKRDAGIKDSGNFFPGHGGVLDRCDGYLLAGPVLYYIVFIDLIFG